MFPIIIIVYLPLRGEPQQLSDDFILKHKVRLARPS